MFKELGSMMNLLGNQSKLQEEMKKFQESLPTLIAEGTAGGGLVTAKANGRLEILQVVISPEALALNDREMLEDLVTAATNMALAKVRELVAARTAAMAQSMGLPPGMLGGSGLPGFGS
jgi:hypothetical protein